MVYMSQMRFEGPVQVSWGIGGRRREVVRRLGRRVRDWTRERRMAFFAGCFPLLDRTGEMFRKSRKRDRRCRDLMVAPCRELLVNKALLAVLKRSQLNPIR